MDEAPEKQINIDSISKTSAGLDIKNNPPPLSNGSVRQPNLVPVVSLVAVVLAVSLTAWIVVRSGVIMELFQSKSSPEEVNSGIIPEEPAAGDYETDAAGVNEIPLSVINPSRDLTVGSGLLDVSGITVPGAEVTVNDKEITADQEGKFTVRLTLEEGENYLTVVATDENGQVAEIERIVTYESAE